MMKHIDEMAARDKVTSLKFKNRAAFIYENYWFVGAEYENEHKKYS